MNARHLSLLTAALTVAALAAAGASAQRVSAGGSVDVRPGLAFLVDTHDSLAAQFRRLADAATAPGAVTAERQALARFVRGAISPVLQRESFELMPVFDSVVGGGYAVPATLLDLDGIAFLVRELERTAGGSDRVSFNERAYALSIALEGHYTKVDLLIVPVLRDRLSPVGLRALAARLEGQPE